MMKKSSTGGVAALTNAWKAVRREGFESQFLKSERSCFQSVVD